MVPEGFRLPPMWTIWGRGRGPKMGHSGCWDVRIASLTWGLCPLVGVFNVLWGDLWLKKNILRSLHVLKNILGAENILMSFLVLRGRHEIIQGMGDRHEITQDLGWEIRQCPITTQWSSSSLLNSRRVSTPPQPPSDLNYLKVPVLETKVLVSILSPLFPSFVGGGGRLLIITS